MKNLGTTLAGFNYFSSIENEESPEVLGMPMEEVVKISLEAMQSIATELRL